MGVGVIAFGYRYLSFISFPNEHYQYLARGQQMLMGALQVRDYTESGLPPDTEAEMPQTHPGATTRVRARYHGVARFPVWTEKQFRVLVENSRRPLSVFGEQGLPCFTPDGGRGLAQIDDYS